MSTRRNFLGILAGTAGVAGLGKLVDPRAAGRRDRELPGDGPWTRPQPAVAPQPQDPGREARCLDVREFGAKGDGATDDAPSIQAAIDALSGRAGTVLVPPGEYLLRAGLGARSGLRLVGTDPSSTLFRAGADFAILTVDGATDIVIEALTFDGGAANGSDRANLVAVGGGAARVVIRNSHLRNARRNAVDVTDSAAVSLLGNAIEAPYKHGIYVVDGVTDLLIQDNTIRDPGGPGADGDAGKGIGVHGLNAPCERVTVVGNRIDGCRQIAIEFFGGRGGPGVHGGSISGNAVERREAGSGQYGISLDHSRAVAVHGNRIRGCSIGLEAAGAHECAFAANLVESTAGIGISVSREASDIEIAGNIVRGTEDYGIQVLKSPRVLVVRNRIENAADRGIFLNELGSDAAFVVTHNTVTGCAASGIYLFKSSGGVVAWNDARGNDTAGRPGEGEVVYNASRVLETGNPG